MVKGMPRYLFFVFFSFVTLPQVVFGQENLEQKKTEIREKALALNRVSNEINYLPYVAVQLDRDSFIKLAKEIAELTNKATPTQITQDPFIGEVDVPVLNGSTGGRDYIIKNFRLDLLNGILEYLEVEKIE